MKKLILTIAIILLITITSYSQTTYTDQDGVLEVKITAPVDSSGITGYELVFYNMEDEVQLKTETDLLFWRFEYVIDKPSWLGKTLKLRVFSILRYSDSNGVHKVLSVPTEPVIITFAPSVTPSPIIEVQ